MQEPNYKNQSDATSASASRVSKQVNDRRFSRRLAISLPIEFCGESPFNPQTFCGRTRNLSAKGIYFVCEEAYLVGQLLHVTIRMSEDPVVGADCLSLTLRYRVQRVEEIVHNSSKMFGVGVALAE